MTDINVHCRTLLAGIIPDRKDLLDIALQHLDSEFFQDPVLKNVFVLMERYAEYGGVITRSVLQDILSKRFDAGKLALYDEVFQDLELQVVTDVEFRWALQEIKDLAAERATGEVLMQGVEMFRSGVTDEKGEERKGHKEARLYITEKFSEIEKDSSKQASPEGDMRQEGAEMIQDYLSRKQDRISGKSKGILFGIDSLDGVVGGLQNGDLAIVAGFSSSGKTSAVVQLAWNCAVEQGHNVAFLTSETLRPQVRRRIISRHSKQHMFELPNGLNSRDIRDGTLSPEEERKFGEIVTDFTKNPAYGKIHIVQIPQGATIGHCASRLNKLQFQFDIKLVIIDYLRLLRPSVKRQSDREEFNSVIIGAKQLATTFADGRGVPVVSPWQTSRQQYEIALKAGYYNPSSLSETSEAFNSPDIVITYLAPDGPKERYCELRAQALKNRDGETAAGLIVNVDYATSYFSTQRSHNLSIGSNTEDFAGLIN